jgi:hypothetical protein
MFRECCLEDASIVGALRPILFNPLDFIRKCFSGRVMVAIEMTEVGDPMRLVLR